MRTWPGKRYWLVGASEGLGRALAHQMSAAGASLVLSARSEARLQELAAELPGPVEVVAFDVTDAARTTDAARQIGTIDGCVYLAGQYWPMAAHDIQPDKANSMAQVNFLGALHVANAICPDFAARGQGHLVFIGSLAGYRGLPGAYGYGASKAGMMHLAENLRADFHKSDIDVQLINPGYIHTRLTAKNDFAMPFVMSSDAAAQAVFDHMQTRRFRKDFPWIFSRLFRLAPWLPEPLFMMIFGAGRR